MQSFKFIILIVIVLVLAHCKKEYRFPEDPGKSKKTPKERLQGAWKLKEYTLNGNSILDSLNKICPCTLTDDILLGYFYVKDENKWDFGINGFGTTGYHSYTAFNDYHYLELGPSDPPKSTKTFNKLFITPFKSIPGVTVRWEVTKLYGNEFNLKLKSDTGEYKMCFVKTNY